MLGTAARAMIAQDAQWAVDALLSAQSQGSLSGLLPLTLLGHTSRIAYEGSAKIRSDDPNLGIPDLAAKLPDRHADVIVRARHATKLLDDNKKTYEDLLAEMARYYALHREEFTGKAIWFARPFEADLGLFVASGYTLLGTIPLQFRLGVSPAISIRDLGPLMYKVAEEQGSVLAVLAAANGDTSTLCSTIDYSPLGRVSAKDRKTSNYLKRRYDPDLPIEAKLLLLMAESEVTTTCLLLPLAESRHKEAVFRVRMVSIFHVLSAITKVLSAYPAAQSAATNRVRCLMEEPVTQRLLKNPEIRKVRNNCMHYQIRENALDVDPSLPMYGIVEALCPGQSFHQLNMEIIVVVDRVVDALRDWSS